MTENVQGQVEEAKNDREHNIAQIRKQLEQERIARQSLEQRSLEMEKALQQRAAPKVDDEDDDDEPYIDKKKLNKTLGKLKAEMEQTIDQRAEQRARSIVEEERNSSYLRDNSDFNEVMDQENVQKFAEKHPAIAKSILSMPDGFERKKLVYETMKALNVHKKNVESSVQSKIDSNRRSPYYQPSGMASPGYNAQGDFSDAGQKTAYNKMKELQRQLRI